MICKKLLSITLVFILATAAFAELRLKNIYQDNMLIQADAPNIIAGWADAGADVILSWNSGKKSGEVKAKADNKGYWQATLPNFAKRTTLEISIKSGAESAKISNLITGELWMASGQSNMQWSFWSATTSRPYKRIENSAEESAKYMEARKAEAAKFNGDIRAFITERKYLEEPSEEVAGKWIVVDPSNLDNPHLSAIGTLFARDIRQALDTPVGLIINAVGGSCAEAWTPKSAFENSKECKHTWENFLASVEKNKEEYPKKREAFLRKFPTKELQKEHAKKAPKQITRTGFNSYTAMYNGMLNGAAPLKPKGVLWYQGESNSGRANEYGDLIKLMVNSWRKHFDTEFWFFYAELAGYQAKQTEPVELKKWGCIREAQREVLVLPKTGVAANADQTAEPSVLTDIHPPYKDVIAGRLVKQALAKTYGKIPLKEAEAPFYKSHKIEGDKIAVEVAFGEGLKKMAKAGNLIGFAIRGDGNADWKWATAEIKGDKIIVSNAEIKKPEAVRYGWAQNPLMSVENKYGLPLMPFSTDRGSQLDFKIGSNAFGE